MEASEVTHAQRCSSLARRPGPGGWRAPYERRPIPQIYYGSSSLGGGLVSAWLDGSGQQFVLPADGLFIGGIAADWVNERIYYSYWNAAGGQFTAELGGANPALLFENNWSFDYVSVDPFAGKVVASAFNGILIANLDRSDAFFVEEDAAYAGWDYGGVDVDVIAGDLCYALLNGGQAVVRCRGYAADATPLMPRR